MVVCRDEFIYQANLKILLSFGFFPDQSQIENDQFQNQETSPSPTTISPRRRNGQFRLEDNQSQLRINQSQIEGDWFRIEYDLSRFKNGQFRFDDDQSWIGDDWNRFEDF